MQNIIPPEWMAILVTIGTVIGTVVLGLFYSRKPPTASEATPVHPSGLLFDSRAVRDLVESIDELGTIVKEGLASISAVLSDKQEAEQMGKLEEILQELKKGTHIPQPPRTRMPPRG